MTTPCLSAKIDKRMFVVLGIFTLLFGSLGGYVFVNQADGWKILLAIVVALAVCWAGALSVRFSCDAQQLSYRSLFRRLSVPVASIEAVEIVAEQRKNAPQGVPRFYLRLVGGKREMLNVKILPLPVVRQLCAQLQAAGVPVHTEETMVAKRMASQVLGAPR